MPLGSNVLFYKLLELPYPYLLRDKLTLFPTNILFYD